MGYWPEDHRGKMRSHHILSREHTANMINDLDHQWEVVCQASSLSSSSVRHPALRPLEEGHCA